MEQIIDTVRSLEGALVILPDENSGLPQLAWGDAFFYYAPDGVMPERTQPYGTIITKNYPDDESSELDRPGRYRVNIHLDRDQAATLTEAGSHPASADVFFSHPLYGTAGWVSVINPSERTAERALALLQEAHETARARALRRRGRQ